MSFDITAMWLMPLSNIRLPIRRGTSRDSSVRFKSLPFHVVLDRMTAGLLFQVLQERRGTSDRGDDGGGSDAGGVVDEPAQIVCEVDAGGESTDRWHRSGGVVG